MDPNRTGLVIAALVVLAGCTGSGVGSSVDPTVTAAPVPTDPEPTPAYRLAPGLSEAGVVGPVSLASAHAEHLRSAPSYRVRIEERVEPVAGGPVEYRVLAGTVGNRTSYSLHVVRGVGNETRFERALYADTRTLYERLVLESGPRYYVPRPQLADGETYPVDPLGQLDQREELYLAFVTSRPTYAGTTTSDGTARHRIVATEAANTELVAKWKYVDAVTAVEFEAIVTDDGLVRSFRLSYVATVDGDRYRVTRTARWTAVGNATVPVPDWYETAREQALD